MKIINPMAYVGTINPYVGKYKKYDESIINTIYDVILYNTGVPMSAINGSNRDKNIREARQLFHYLVRKMTNESLSNIGGYTNNSHCTVIHSVKVVNDVMSYNKKLVLKVDYLINEVKRRVDNDGSGTVKDNK